MPSLEDAFQSDNGHKNSICTGLSSIWKLSNAKYHIIQFKMRA